MPGSSSSSFRGRRQSADRPASSGRVLLLLLAWAAALTGWGYAAGKWLAVSPRHFWNAELERRAPPFARYDSGWYLGIVERGYGPAHAPGQSSEHAFFPLYPELLRAVARATGTDPVRTGPILSTIFAIAALWLFWREGLRRLGPRLARDALLFLLLFPTSFFLLAMYSESLFLLLAVAAFAMLARRHFAVATLLGLFAGLTRAPALALCAPLLLAAWPGRDGGPAPTRRRIAAVAVALAPAAGVLLWVAIVAWITGLPDGYLRAQSGWHRGISPLAGAAHWAAALPERIAHGDLLEKPAFVLDYLDVLLFAAIGVFQLRKRRWSDASFTAGALLLPIATGVPVSVPRYVLVVYPAFFALAEAFEGRPLLRRLWWIGSALLLAAGAAAFVHWRWVA